MYEELNIASLFKKYAEKNPDKPAVKINNISLSYGQLDSVANRIANTIILTAHDDKNPVLVLCEKSIFQVAAILGVLKTGRIFVPIDHSQPRPRLINIIKDTGAKVAVSDYLNLETARTIASEDAVIINAEALDNDISDVQPDLDISPDDLCSIFYTSGSTGTPKGVMQTHRNIHHSCKSFIDGMGINSDARIMRVGPLAFAGGFKSLIACLISGASFVAMHPEPIKELYGFLNREKITVCHLSSIVFRAFLGGLDGNISFPMLRWFYTAGDKLRSEEATYFRRFFPSECELMHAFALTEAGTVCQYLFDFNNSVEAAAIPVGYPVKDTEVLILDAQGLLLSDGIPGELAIRSRFLSPGYWNNKTMTEKAFIKDPSGKRIYHTGDMGMKQPDGCVIHLGRKDFQVKILGHSVNTSEIEQALCLITAVKDSEVLAADNDSGYPILIAYVVCEQDGEIGSSFLKSRLQQIFPQYMIPSFFIFLDEFPLNAGGKVDRKALPVPEMMLSNTEPDIDDSWSKDENIIAEIWKDVLNLERAGINDNFFDLGGDSLNAALLALRLEKQYDRKVPVTLLYHAPTIKELAEMLHTRKWSTPWTSLVEIQKGETMPPFFCVHTLNGSVLSYADLAFFLGPEQPFYGLQSSGLNTRGSIHTNVQHMAEYYVKQIQAVQPTGPYFIGGVCFGGMVAFEMARLLQLKKQKIAFLVMIDTPNAGSLQKPIPTNHWIYRIEHFQVLSALSAFMAKRTRKNNELLNKILLTLKMRMSAWMDIIPEKRIKYVRRMNIKARSTYKPGPYDGRITCILAEKTLKPLRNPQNGWERLAKGGIDIILLPLKHNTILTRPNVQMLADSLKNHLTKAQKKATY